MSRLFFHASDHRFAPGEQVRPGSEIGKAGLSGGPVADSREVWLQDDVHEIYTYGDHLFVVDPTGPVSQAFPHVFTATGAIVVREITDRAEYVRLASNLRR